MDGTEAGPWAASGKVPGVGPGSSGVRQRLALLFLPSAWGDKGAVLFGGWWDVPCPGVTSHEMGTPGTTGVARMLA